LDPNLKLKENQVDGQARCAQISPFTQYHMIVDPICHALSKQNLLKGKGLVARIIGSD